jgi:HEAT repeat protein
VSGERASAGAGDAARIARVRSLAADGEPSIAALTAMLSDPSWSVRREVVAALAQLGDRAVPALTSCLQTARTSEASIAACVDALVANVGGSVDGALMALVSEHTPGPVLADVAQVLGRRRSSAANDVLRQLTLYADDNVAVSAIEALGRLGGRAAVDALIACVNSNNFFRTFPAIDVLGRSGDPRAVEPLTQLLLDSRYTLEAARALGRSADRRAVAPLFSLLGSPADSHVRIACIALMELRDRHLQLYGSASVLSGFLRDSAEVERAGGGVEGAGRAEHLEGMARRVGQSAIRADKLEKVAACRLLGEFKVESTTPLLLSLLDAGPEVGEAAAAALAEIGKSSVGALSTALSEGNSSRRAALLPVVRSLDNAEAVLGCLSDASVDVRVLAAEALARIGAVSAVPALFDLLADEQQRVVHAAVAAVQSLGTAETEALALEAAGSTHPTRRRAGLRVLAYFGFPSALPLFGEAIRADDGRAVDAALQGLALLDQPEATALLLAAADDPKPSLRAAAMRALGQHPSDPAVHERLLRALKDAEPWVRYYACQALGKQATDGVEGDIRALLDDAAGQVRVAAVEALSHASSASALEILRELLLQPDVDIRRAALVGLGLRGDRESLEAISAVAISGDSATRLVALSALAGIPGEGVVTVLGQAAADAQEAVRTAALTLLSERSGREAADTLVSLLDKHGEQLPLLSALASPLAGRLDALEAALKQADDDRAALLVSCLSRSGAQGAAEALLRTLSSTNRAARKAAVTTLAALGSQEAWSAIEQLSLSDPDPDVRTTCLLCLAP